MKKNRLGEIVKYHHSDFNDDGDELCRVYFVEPENFEEFNQMRKALEAKEPEVIDYKNLIKELISNNIIGALQAIDYIKENYQSGIIIKVVSDE